MSRPVHDTSVAQYPLVTPSGNAVEPCRGSPNRAVFEIGRELFRPDPLRQIDVDATTAPDPETVRKVRRALRRLAAPGRLPA